MGAHTVFPCLGLVVEPDRMYSQVVPVSFNVTMAALGPVAATSNSNTGSMTSPSKASGAPSQKRSFLMLTHQKDGEFALCSLAPESQPNQTLDLVFLEGETIHFRVVGEQAIHLTGYYFEDLDEGAGVSCGGGYDSEEIEAELNGEDIEDTDSERDDTEEDGDEDEDEEVDSDMADFINDEELDEDDVSDSETATETEGEQSETEVRRKRILSRKPKSHPRIKEVTSDEAETDEDEDEDEERDFEVLSVSEDSQVEHSDEDDEDEDDEEEGSTEEESEDEEVDSDEAGSVDMSPGRKTASKKSPQQPEAAKRTKIEVNSPQEEKKKTASSSMISPAASSPAAGSPAKGTTPNGKNKTLPSGLQIEDIKLGAGIKAQKGRRVTISYTMLANSNKSPSSSSAPAASGTFQFNLGDADVAKGIAIGVQGMALGGERRLVIPATMIDEKARPVLPKSGNCILHVKLDAVQPASKSS